MPSAATLLIEKLRIDGGTQPRASIDPATVNEYAAVLDDKDADLEPVEVVKDDAGNHWLWDGFHRREAYIKAGRDKMPANVRKGTQRDALLLSFGANAKHGLKRTNDEKRNAVTRMLEDKEWAKWSDRKIAEACAVSKDLVGSLRPVTVGNDSDNGPRKYTTKHGNVSTMKTEKIGKGRQPKQEVKEQPEPAAPATKQFANEEIPFDDAPEIEDDKPALDKAGLPFPPQALAAVAGQGRLNEICRDLRSLIELVRQVKQEPVGLYLDATGICDKLDKAKGSVLAAQPTHVCGYCSGKDPACKVCRGHGWQSKIGWDSSPKGHEEATS